MYAILREMKLKNAFVLHSLGYGGSLLCKAGIRVNEIQDEYNPDVCLPNYATIQGYKGLDSKIVILVDLDLITDRNYSKYIYLAATRARTLLYVVGTAEFWEKHK